MDEKLVDEVAKTSVVKKCPSPKEGKPWCLFDHAGKKVIGYHPTEEKAKGQERAIQVSKQSSVQRKLEVMPYVKVAELFYGKQESIPSYADVPRNTLDKLKKDLQEVGEVAKEAQLRTQPDYGSEESLTQQDEEVLERRADEEEAVQMLEKGLDVSSKDSTGLDKKLATFAEIKKQLAAEYMKQYDLSGGKVSLFNFLQARLKMEPEQVQEVFDEVNETLLGKYHHVPAPQMNKDIGKQSKVAQQFTGSMVLVKIISGKYRDQYGRVAQWDDSKHYQQVSIRGDVVELGKDDIEVREQTKLATEAGTRVYSDETIETMNGGRFPPQGGEVMDPEATPPGHEFAEDVVKVQLDHIGPVNLTGEQFKVFKKETKKASKLSYSLDGLLSREVAGRHFVDSLTGETYFEKGDSISPKVSSVKERFKVNEKLFEGMRVPRHMIVSLAEDATDKPPFKGPESKEKWIKMNIRQQLRRDGEPLSSDQIANSLGRNVIDVVSVLDEMVESEELSQDERGLYVKKTDLPATASKESAAVVDQILDTLGIEK